MELLGEMKQSLLSLQRIIDDKLRQADRKAGQFRAVSLPVRDRVDLVLFAYLVGRWMVMPAQELSDEVRITELRVKRCEQEPACLLGCLLACLPS